MLRFLLILVWLTHSLVFVVNTLAIVVLPFTEPLWVWLPLCTFLVRASYGHACPFTMAENILRTRLGMPTIAGFVEHYIWRKA